MGAPVEACGATTAPAEIVRSWPRDEYLLVLFGGDGPAAAETRKAVKALEGKVNLKLVDASSPAAGAEAPGGAALVSPRGRLLARFDKPPAAADLERLWRSPAKTALAKALAESDAVVLVFTGERSKHGKANLARAREEARSADELLVAKTAVLDLDPSEAAEAALALNLGLPAEGACDGFAVVFASGRVLDVVKGEAERGAVLDRLQYLFSPATSCFPCQFDEDLLMEWSKR